MNSRITNAIIIIVFLLLVAVAFQLIHPTSQQVAAPMPGVRSGSASLYPNSSLTPGDVLTTDANVVCQQGYSHTVRNVSVDEKRAVYDEYGISYPQPRGSYEVDHFISLELGGSNDIKNLWPEPAEPKPGFHEKDEVENYLHEQVCNGTISLSEAQKDISTDWYAVYSRIHR